MADEDDDFGPLLTRCEVAQLFRVDPKTITRWAAAGKLRFIRTPGGHRRFLEREVRDLLAALRPGEVAALFRVDRNTVTRWADAGRLKHITTPGGEHRFYEAEVRNFLERGIYPSGRKIHWLQVGKDQPATSE